MLRSESSDGSAPIPAVREPTWSRQTRSKGVIRQSGYFVESCGNYSWTHFPGARHALLCARTGGQHSRDLCRLAGKGGAIVGLDKP